MDDQTLPPEENAPDWPDGEKTTPRRRTGVWLLIIVMVLAAAGFIAWQWWTDTVAEHDLDVTEAALAPMRTELAATHQALDSLQAQVDRLAERPPNPAIETLRTEIDALEARTNDRIDAEQGQSRQLDALQSAVTALNERQSVAETTLNALSSRQRPVDEALDVAEAAYLARLAQERIALFGDVRGAAEALALADRQLAWLDNPLYLPARQAIAAAQARLAAVRVPDAVALSAELDGLQEGIFDWPLADEFTLDTQTPAPEPDGWWARLRRNLGQLVTVRRSEEAESLTLADRQAVRHAVWSDLESARLAMARRDGRAWQSSLERADGRIERWFAADAPGVVAGREQIAALLDAEWRPPLPDLSEPAARLDAVRDDLGVPRAAAAPSMETEALPEADAPEPADAGESQEDIEP